MADGSRRIARLGPLEGPPHHRPVDAVRDLKVFILAIAKLGTAHPVRMVTVTDGVMVIVQLPHPPFLGPVVAPGGGGESPSIRTPARLRDVDEDERRFGPMTAPASYGFFVVVVLHMLR